MNVVRRTIAAGLVGAVLLSACAGASVEPDAGTTPGFSCLDDPAAKCRKLDLEGVDLTGRELAGRDLAYSDLDGTDLTGVDLSGVNLTGASLRGAKLRGADLSRANLYGADAREADLVDSDLTGSNLTETNFYGADLNGALLDGALLQRTSFGAANLSEASARHTIATRVDLRDANLSQSNWENSIARAEYAHAAELENRGAIVCGFTACSGGTTASVTEGDAIIDPDTFRVALLAQMRMAQAYLADPVSLSRQTATSMLGAIGVYELDLTVQGWTPPTSGLPEGLQDVAALYALNNVAMGVRFDTEDTTRNTILQPVEGPRDTVLWRMTENIPETRAAIVRAATLSSAAALERAANDGFTERLTTYDVDDGDWQPTPPGFAPALEPGWGQLLTFGDSSRQCRAGAPAIGAEDVQEVVDIAKNLTREQKGAAKFWDDERIRTTTPIGHWHDIAVQMLEQKLRDGEVLPREALETMAEMHMAMADAMIMVWYEKYTYRTARPLTVIRASDPYWNSYLGNLSSPAYPSEHAAMAVAAAEVLARGLGDFEYTDDRFSVSSGTVETPNTEPRTYPNVRVAAEEAALSRVWGGIQFMGDIEGGRRIGLCTADSHTGR